MAWMRFSTLNHEGGGISFKGCGYVPKNIFRFWPTTLLRKCLPSCEQRQLVVVSGSWCWISFCGFVSHLKWFMELYILSLQSTWIWMWNITILAKGNLIGKNNKIQFRGCWSKSAMLTWCSHVLCKNILEYWEYGIRQVTEKIKWTNLTNQLIC